MEGHAKYVIKRESIILSDTIWCNYSQSLLVTQMRTQDLTNAANFANLSLRDAFSLNMWVGTTFDVVMFFLHEFPWERLETLREKVPDVPFQMLLRRANDVGYTNYPGNVVHKVCIKSSKSGVDVLHVVNSFNYTKNLKLDIDAVSSTGWFV